LGRILIKDRGMNIKYFIFGVIVGWLIVEALEPNQAHAQMPFYDECTARYNQLIDIENRRLDACNTLYFPDSGPAIQCQDQVIEETNNQLAADSYCSPYYYQWNLIIVGPFHNRDHHLERHPHFHPNYNGPHRNR